MSPPPDQARAGPRRFPRVSGDEPVNDAGYAAETAFSPRERE